MYAITHNLLNETHVKSSIFLPNGSNIFVFQTSQQQLSEEEEAINRAGIDGIIDADEIPIIRYDNTRFGKENSQQETIEHFDYCLP